MSKQPHPGDVNRLAYYAARVLSEFGVENPTWSEWDDLKRALLNIHPFLGRGIDSEVGKACSKFQEAQRKDE